ncbi:MAG: electron transfer flavoprotein subunit beta/FixA family protein [Peptoniphilaceae bacterium]|nr:electron transfer flavoprotein subunit beta/FixA family protein [Peptoniphilaceae bacterium]MDD7383390.1 electron transfer flavoprotein subunit beta/FixA family protein [Peptoniphilaceae bacterium]MDY3738239.1 electron transfer flavoprotein subunit beta/FixA family protein [Peptoniphilaceae bacterium]
MNIVVLVKQVPNTNEVKLDPKTGTMIRDGVESIVNPDDKAGLEEALKIKDKINAHVTVVSMGPNQAKEALRECYAMGADECILLTDRKFGGADTWATSQALAACLRELDYDLIIAGRQAIDGDTAQVGPETAEHLGIPSISYVEEIVDYTDKDITVKRQFEDRYHLLKAKFPCLITTLGEMNSPRYMKVSRVYESYKNDVIRIMTADDVKADPENLGLLGSPTRVRKSFTKGAKTAGKLFDVTAEEGAEIIINKLSEDFII